MSDATVDAAAGDAAPKKGKGKTLLIVIVLAVVLLAGGGAAAFFLLGSHGKDKKAEAKKEEPAAPALYVALDPPFVVNFEAEQQVRFLQVTAQLMTRDPKIAELLKANDPVVRNDLLLLFGNQKYTVISTREGKESLRKETLDAVRKIVKTAGGKPEGVEAVYFTSFVMQ